MPKQSRSGHPETQQTREITKSTKLIPPKFLSRKSCSGNFVNQKKQPHCLYIKFSSSLLQNFRQSHLLRNERINRLHFFERVFEG
jgi:hypothetical protein